MPVYVTYHRCSEASKGLVHVVMISLRGSASWREDSGRVSVYIIHHNSSTSLEASRAMQVVMKTMNTSASVYGKVYIFDLKPAAHVNF